MLSRLLPRVVRSGVQSRTASMFCYQCEQTENSRSCVKVGNCGKTPSTAGLQDTLIHTLKGISMYTWPMLKENPSLNSQLKEQNRWMLEALFSTLTNVNFDDNRFFEYLDQAEANIKDVKGKYSSSHQEALKGPATWKNEKNHKKLVNDSRWFGIEVRRDGVDPDIFSLQELIVYGLKGLAAYAHHAMVLGKEDDQVYSFVYEVLSVLGKGEANADELLGYVLKLGEVNLRVMQLLSEGHESNFGVPTPSRVQLSPVPGKCILVSGHDLKDLQHLLEQTAGKGINVFTHGEMLPGHGYPELNKYPHLVGNYGDAWQAQRKDFSSFPGPILMTTNCLIQPTSSYAKRLFTRSAVGWPGVRHIKDYDFSEVVKCALECEGFEEADCPREHHHTMTGFGHKTVLSLADKIIEGVQKGQIGSFFVIGGCDGAKEERNYFKDMAHSVPKDGVVLTLGCGKYRFNKDFDKFGDIGGIPRLLDMGQCNDAYSAIQVAVALAEALKVPSVNHLPLHFGISWFEQKAVAVFCTMLHLGLRNIHLGPSLPAFLSPNVLKLLVEKYNVTPAVGDGAEAAKKLAAAGNNL